ncbi:probable rhamnogalacturonate lyase B [Triticum dicoccoides]|uniref:probable rhamnogalacturonate lyase B n=1 Tax=Triticum dicoccoides TaxID=85692 RepID=UPI0018916364|nr:probable rhamnogalacturonate lyase B [Triticum dicoccoides]
MDELKLRPARATLLRPLHAPAMLRSAAAELLRLLAVCARRHQAPAPALTGFTGSSTNGSNPPHMTDGYWDVVWNFPGSGYPRGMNDMLDGTEFRVVSATEEQVELSFMRTYDPSRLNSIPLTVDKRLVMLRGGSGFYCYAIFEHAGGWPAVDVSEARLVFKLDPTTFNYMAISDGIQRYMPGAADRDAPRAMPLAYKEAVLLVHPSEPQFAGEVDDKYQYSMDNKDNRVHGWIAGARGGGGVPVPVGFWVVTPSNEFKSGGPLKRELTSHIGPTSLTMFMGTHYIGKDMVAKIEAGEHWKKVMGPVFIYLNSNPQRGALWEDAKAQAEVEASRWPYSFPESPDFHKAGERGSVTGRLMVRDRYTSGGEDVPARLAYVGLAAPGQPGSSATESKGYQFWTRASATGGTFTIDNIRSGEYNLYAWVPGVLGDYMRTAPVTVVPGGAVALGDLVFEPPRSGPTLWEIGVPDRSAAEFFVPDPNPRYLSKLFVARDKYRQYGLWERYAELYPAGDPVFTIGVSNPFKDWFFAHVTRKTGNGENVPTTRRIRFNLPRVAGGGTYTLRIALAAAHMSKLKVQVNGATGKGSAGGVFLTPEFGDDNAIARHGEHGRWWSFEFPIDGRLLVQGENTIGITQPRASSVFVGVMFDYVRLEGPSGWDSGVTTSAGLGKILPLRLLCGLVVLPTLIFLLSSP